VSFRTPRRWRDHPGPIWFLARISWLVACFRLLLAASLFAADTNGPPEVWVTNQVLYPSRFASLAVQTNRFEQLQAEFLAETVRVLWTPLPGDTAAQATLLLSVDEPGHWPARDWRSYPMARRGADWEAIVLVDSLDVPLIYFVAAAADGRTHLSPMRLCRPRALGLEQPTRIFWPFLEGFEEGTESWRWLAGGPDDERFSTSTTVKNGKVALAVTIPPGKTSVTLGTTRLRGWLVLEHAATGVAFWMRTQTGSGLARFTLLANAFTTNQVVALRPKADPVGAQWQELALPFESFGRFPLCDLDFFTIELLGKPGTEFLLDDMQLMGRWIRR
jgi:hypothetical protein